MHEENPLKVITSETAMYDTPRPLSGDFPLTQRETENIGHAARDAMRRAERAVRNWPNIAYHQVFNDAWEMIEDFYEELIFFCPSPAHVQMFSDWMVYNRDVQVRHVHDVLAVHERRRQHPRMFHDHLANARQRRADLEHRLAEVRDAEQQDREAEQHSVQQAQLRDQQGTTSRRNTINEHRDRITIWQQEAAAARAATPTISPAPTNNAPATATQAPAAADAPISVEAFSGILNSGSFTTITNNPASLYRATVEDVTDEEYASPTYRLTGTFW
jgi:hypothetical protein